MVAVAEIDYEKTFITRQGEEVEGPYEGEYLVWYGRTHGNLVIDIPKGVTHEDISHLLGTMEGIDPAVRSNLVEMVDRRTVYTHTWIMKDPDLPK